MKFYFVILYNNTSEVIKSLFPRCAAYKTSRKKKKTRTDAIVSIWKPSRIRIGDKCHGNPRGNSSPLLTKERNTLNH